MQKVYSECFVFRGVFRKTFAKCEKCIAGLTRADETEQRDLINWTVQKLKTELYDYCGAFAVYDNNLWQSGLIQHQINSANHPSIEWILRRVENREEMEWMIE